MFVLVVHSVDASHPLQSENAFLTTPTTKRSTSKSNRDTTFYSERRGVVHLYRIELPPSIVCSASRSTSLFVVAVPDHVSAGDFIRFCGSGVDDVIDLIFIRNDEIEDCYSVLIKFDNQLLADEFYNNSNGKRLSSVEIEVCHILFVASVKYTELAKIADMPPEGFVELPTCAICLERLDQDTSGILDTFCNHSFQCSCTLKWTHLSCPVCRLCHQQDKEQVCSVCGTEDNLWVCLICAFVGCGRYKEGHAIKHSENTHHCYSLDLITQQIWDYIGDKYVHRVSHSKVDGNLVDSNSSCMLHNCHSDGCGCSKDSGINEVIFSSKIEVTVDEYNHLLTTQLENQRQYYESLLMDAKSSQEASVSEVVEKNEASLLQDIQTKFEKCKQEKNAVADTNQCLIKEQKEWSRKVKEIEDREAADLEQKEQKIHNLEEQIRDLTVYIKAQKTFDTMMNAADFQQGMILPLPSVVPLLEKNRRQPKHRRRQN